MWWHIFPHTNPPPLPFCCVLRLSIVLSRQSVWLHFLMIMRWGGGGGGGGARLMQQRHEQKKKDIRLAKKSEFNIKWYNVELSNKKQQIPGTLWEGRVCHEFQPQVKELLFVSSGLINCENTSLNETYLKDLFRRVISWQVIDGGGGSSWIPSDYFCCIFKSDQLQCHYLEFMFTLSPDDVKQFNFFTQAQLNSSAFIMCPDIILESYYVTGSDNNGASSFLITAYSMLYMGRLVTQTCVYTAVVTFSGPH